MRVFLARPTAALLLSLAGFTAHALDNSIRISQENIDKLGIQLGKPEPVTQIPLLTAPAKVAVPPSQEYIVSTSQAGFIEKMNAGIGDKVGKGQVVAQVNSPDLVTLQRDYLKAVSAMELATAIYQRDKKLLQEGVIADRRWQETSSEYRSAVSEADEHRQLLEIAGMAPADVAQFSKTHKLSRELNIRSPIAGVVMERMAVVGTHIDAMAPLYRIANLDELWLEIAIPQERAAGIKTGDKVQVENSDVSARELATAIYHRDQKLLQEGVISDRRWQETSTEYRSTVSEADEHRQLLEIAGMSPADVAQFGKTHK
ncbi:MAG: efflux RND transporter periplasmic adaptor subunit, partial [Methylobacter sp.]